MAVAVVESIYCDGKRSTTDLVEVLSLHSDLARRQVGTAWDDIIGDLEVECEIDVVLRVNFRFHHHCESEL